MNTASVRATLRRLSHIRESSCANRRFHEELDNDVVQGCERLCAVHSGAQMRSVVEALRVPGAERAQFVHDPAVVTPRSRGRRFGLTPGRCLVRWRTVKTCLISRLTEFWRWPPRRRVGRLRGRSRTVQARPGSRTRRREAQPKAGRHTGPVRRIGLAEVLDLQLLNPLTDRLHACAIGAATISGPLSVGVIPTVAPYLLPPILAGFTRKYPLARVSVVEEITRK
jgi:hypothetical protein